LLWRKEFAGLSLAGAVPSARALFIPQKPAVWAILSQAYMQKTGAKPKKQALTPKK